MKKVLWLTSWYPNRTDKFTGDFIQRHAQAASQFNQIIVLHVAKAGQNEFQQGAREEIRVRGNLTEHIVYFRCGISWAVANRVVSTGKYLWHFRKLIRTYVQAEKKPHLVHVHVPLKAGLLALWIKQKFKIPYLLTEHHGIYNSVVSAPYSKRSWIFRHYTKKILRQASVFTPVSRYLGEAICSWVYPKPFRVIFNTVNTDLFHLAEPAAGKFRYVHVSGMEPVKQVDGILRAFWQAWKENPLLELMLVGKPDQQVLRESAQTGLVGKAIFFAGEVQYGEVARELQRSHAMILFSKMENMPCVILEALCSGIPLIATNVGGIPEVISADNGILLAPGDEIALRQAILSLVELYGRFDRQAIAQQAALQFSYPAIGMQLDDVYTVCLAEAT